MDNSVPSRWTTGEQRPTPLRRVQNRLISSCRVTTGPGETRACRARPRENAARESHAAARRGEALRRADNRRTEASKPRQGPGRPDGGSAGCRANPRGVCRTGSEVSRPAELGSRRWLAHKAARSCERKESGRGAHSGRARGCVGDERPATETSEASPADRRRGVHPSRHQADGDPERRTQRHGLGPSRGTGAAFVF